MNEVSKHGIYKKLAFDFAKYSFDVVSARIGKLDELSDNIDHSTIFEASTARGFMIPPLTFMTMLAQYPDVINDPALLSYVGFDVPRLLFNLSEAECVVEEMSIDMASIIHKVKPEMLETPPTIDLDNEYKGYTVMCMHMATIITGRCMDELKAEKDQGFHAPEAVVRAMGIQALLSSTLLCVSDILDNDAAMRGFYPDNYEQVRKRFDETHQFAKQTQKTINSLHPRF